MAETKDVFKTLSSVDVSNHIDVIPMHRGRDLKYVSWSWAWSMVKNQYPDTPTPKFTKYPEMIMATKQEAYKAQSYGKEYTKYKTVVVKHELTGRQVPYLNTPTGTMVECTITINDHNYTESLYVMDNANNAVINPTMQQINKTQKRCMVKCLAMAGLGLNLYAGEDLPMGDINSNDKQQAAQKAANNQQQKKQNPLQKLANEYQQKLQTAVQATGSTQESIVKNVVDTCKSDVKGYAEFDQQQQLKQWIKVLDGIIQNAAQVDMFAEND